MLNPDPMLVALLEATVNAGASDLHLTAGRPATARRDGVLVPFEGVEVLTGPDTERMVMSLLDHRQKDELDEAPPGRLLVRHRRHRPLPRQRLQAAQHVRPRPARGAQPRALARRARLPAGHDRSVEQAVRSGARRGPHRLRQEHHAGGDDRPDQRDQAVPHPDDRRPGRVPAPPQDGDDQPARSGHRREQLHRRSAQCAS